MAVKIAKEGKGTSAVAMMCAGMPFANFMGVPLGTFLSHNLSWRAPFLMSILLGLITLYMIYRWVPNVEALPNNGMKAQFRFLRNLVPWLIIATTFLGSAGMLSWFSYISPLLQMEGGFSASKDLLADDSRRWRYGGGQSDERSAVRQVQAGSHHQLLSCACSHKSFAHLLLQCLRLGSSGADVLHLCLSLRCRFARAVPHREAL